MQSFPSGHAAVAFAAMVYMSLLLQQQVNVSTSVTISGSLSNLGSTTSASLTRPLWPQLLAWSPCLVALFISASRVMDYFHFVEDVVCGGVLGSAAAILVFQAQFAKRKEQRRRDVEDLESEQGDFNV